MEKRKAFDVEDITLKQFVEEADKYCGEDAKILEQSNEFALIAKDEEKMAIIQHMSSGTFVTLASALLDKAVKEEKAKHGINTAIATAMTLITSLAKTLDEVMEEDDKFRETLVFNVLHTLPMEAQASKDFYVTSDNGMLIRCSVATLLSMVFATLEETSKDTPEVRPHLADLIKHLCDEVLLK